MNKIKSIITLLCFLIINTTLKGMTAATSSFSCDSDIKASAWHLYDKVLALGLDNQVKMVDMVRGQEQYSLKIDSDITSIAWRPNATMLAIGGSDGFDGKIEIFDTTTKQHIQNHTFDYDIVHSIAWHPSRRHLTVGLNSGAINVFDVNTWDKLHVFTAIVGSICSLLWSPDGKILAAKELQLKKRKRGIEGNFLVHTCDIMRDELDDGMPYGYNPVSFAWKDDGKLVSVAYFCTKSKEGIGYDVFNQDCSIDSCSKSFKFLKEMARIESVAYNPHRNYLAAGLEDGDIKIFTLEPKIAPVYTIYDDMNKIRLMEWHPNKQHVALAVIRGQTATCYE